MAWKEQISRELKGEDFNAIQWKNENGFVVEPFYTAENTRTKYSPAFTHKDWSICVKTKYTDPAQINAHLLRSLEQGAEAIWVECKPADRSAALNDVRLDMIESVFCVGQDEFASFRSFAKNAFSASDRFSIFHGELQGQSDLLLRMKFLDLSPWKNASCFSADVLGYHNQGCHASYELALALSMLNEITECAETKIKNTSAIVRMGASSDFFIEIAKFRAMRRLWDLYCSETGIKSELRIVAESSRSNKTLQDAHSNLLRTTLESLAAVAGGSNLVIVNEFDLFSNEPSRIAERMSINQQHILREESYLGAVSDVACGSYYIEHLTDQLATQALGHFKRFEKAGGYFQCKTAGQFEKEIGDQAEKRLSRIRNAEDIIIGLNKYQLPKKNLKVPSGFSELRNLRDALALQIELEQMHHEKTA